MSNFGFVYRREAVSRETDIEMTTVMIIHIHINIVLWFGTQTSSKGPCVVDLVPSVAILRDGSNSE